MNKARFRQCVRAMPCNIEGRVADAEPKTFPGGSMGWFQQKIITVVIDGQMHKCTATVRITVHGSKQWQQG